MQYSKYSASGNDFVIFHTIVSKDYSTLAKQLCHRQNGIGADGLIVLIPHESYDFEWLFYNSDGSTASMCGNGTRACAHYAYNNGLAPSQLSFLTNAGKIECTVDNDMVETLMPEPKLLQEPFEENGFVWYFVDTGVPHLVTLVDNLELYDKQLASSMRYKYNANVNFAKVNQDGTLNVRTYERGVEDETLACGTGMVACVLRSMELGLVNSPVYVYPKSYEEIVVTKDENGLFFKGKVKEVFKTCI